MNNCHLWILKIYQVDIRNIHYPWYIDGIRKIYAKIYTIVYYVFCTVRVGVKSQRRLVSELRENYGMDMMYYVIYIVYGVT